MLTAKLVLKKEVKNSYTLSEVAGGFSLRRFGKKKKNNNKQKEPGKFAPEVLALNKTLEFTGT